MLMIHNNAFIRIILYILHSTLFITYFNILLHWGILYKFAQFIFRLKLIRILNHKTIEFIYMHI
jgi:hypothetical protein